MILGVAMKICEIAMKIRGVETKIREIVMMIHDVAKMMIQNGTICDTEMSIVAATITETRDAVLMMTDVARIKTVIAIKALTNQNLVGILSKMRVVTSKMKSDAAWQKPTILVHAMNGTDVMITMDHVAVVVMVVMIVEEVVEVDVLVVEVDIVKLTNLNGCLPLLIRYSLTH
jgi:hypothetical protein